MDKKTKNVFQLDTPFTTTKWPEISPKDQDHILELLCSLISPIGKHRTNNTPAKSKGKRAKRSRKEAKDDKDHLQPENSIPPPEISSFISIGLRAITRRLESSSKISKPNGDQEKASINDATTEPPEPKSTISKPSADNKEEAKPLHFSAIFVLRNAHEKLNHDHLPQLVATSSLAHPHLPATRLVQLPESYGPRICNALVLPRVNFIALHDGAPHAGQLVYFVRMHVAKIVMPWLEEVRSAEYLPVKINTIETTTGPPKEKKDEKKWKKNVFREIPVGENDKTEEVCEA
ncbi:hypothetical protein HYFRA_00009173 [Hymenoscyphus fraxineus]|uniref:Uncharacterized protein n=1 Tax=Hymenoscyphus fraxineus TaxID=746836 RepID=A0A9N9KUP6_9HELO|nr:hypothetical protein HYFRA_00009173 [Hymenoscyphus fraxineus]